MFEDLAPHRLVQRLKKVLGQLKDHRTGQNTQYEMQDAGLGAFSVFFTQSASFLAHQLAMKLSKGRSNAENLFEMGNIPSDNQIRSMLDPVEPSSLSSLFGWVFAELDRGGIIEPMRSFSRQILVAIDGTEYFSSKKIHCDQCSHRVLVNGEINYFHSVITPVIVQPGNSHVITLEPEFIVPQDGHEKQDCEIEAAKRWINGQGLHYASQGVTILGDDLFSRQPFCQTLKNNKFHFILICKEDSHLMLYETVAFLATNQVLPTVSVRRWNGRFGEIDTYHYANKLPLRGDQETIEVNWCEIITTREDSGETLYHNAFITDFVLTETTVVAIVRDGRARWKIENENNNVLKTKGYHLEHNFGHGNQHLAAFLLTLNLLAFLFHTVLDLVDARYQLLRQTLKKRQTFFHDLETLLRYFVFDNWDHLLNFMIKGLELNSPAPS